MNIRSISFRFKNLIIPFISNNYFFIYKIHKLVSPNTEYYGSIGLTTLYVLIPLFNVFA